MSVPIRCARWCANCDHLRRREGELFIYRHIIHIYLRKFDHSHGAPHGLGIKEKQVDYGRERWSTSCEYQEDNTTERIKPRADPKSHKHQNSRVGITDAAKARDKPCYSAPPGNRPTTRRAGVAGVSLSRRTSACICMSDGLRALPWRTSAWAVRSRLPTGACHPDILYRVARYDTDIRIGAARRWGSTVLRSAVDGTICGSGWDTSALRSATVQSNAMSRMKCSRWYAMLMQ